MTKLIFIGVFLVTINTVLPNEKSKVLMNPNDTPKYRESEYVSNELMNSYSIKNKKDTSKNAESENVSKVLVNSKDSEHLNDTSKNIESKNVSKRLMNSNDTENKNNTSKNAASENVSKVLQNSNDTSKNNESKNVSKVLMNSNDTKNKNNTSKNAESKNVSKVLINSNDTENKNNTSKNAGSENVSKVLMNSNDTKNKYNTSNNAESKNVSKVLMNSNDTENKNNTSKNAESKNVSKVLMNSNDTSKNIESKNVSKVLMNSNDTSNKNDTFTQLFLVEEYDYGVDSRTNIVWERFLAAKELKNIHKVKIRRTTPMEKGPRAVTKRSLRRQRPRLENKRVDAYRFINIRQPYWKYGHQMFLGPKLVSKQTTKGEVIKGRMLTFNDCNPSCIYYFVSYGKVCGHRYNTQTWLNEYRNFSDMCEMDRENCVNDTKNWHPMYRGHCFVDPGLHQIPALALDYKAILERKKKWADYVYVPPTSSLFTTAGLNLDDLIKKFTNK